MTPILLSFCLKCGHFVKIRLFHNLDSFQVFLHNDASVREIFIQKCLQFFTPWYAGSKAPQEWEGMSYMLYMQYGSMGSIVTFPDFQRLHEMRLLPVYLTRKGVADWLILGHLMSLVISLNSCHLFRLEPRTTTKKIPKLTSKWFKFRWNTTNNDNIDVTSKRVSDIRDCRMLTLYQQDWRSNTNPILTGLEVEY